MQLWKKNFLFVFALLQGLLFIGLFIIVNYNFQQSLKTKADLFNELRQDNQSLVDKIIDNQLPIDLKYFIKKVNDQQQFYFRIKRDENLLFSSIPQDIKLSQTERTELMNSKGKHFFTYADRSAGTEISYVMDSSDIYKAYDRQRFYCVFFGSLFSLLIGGILYLQMKKIYKPIQNLSHELRTPLTLISGYSELLIRMKTTEEQKITMGTQIVEESQHLQEVIEQLLLMGDLKEGEVTKESLLLSDLVENIKDNFPSIKLSKQNEQAVYGNRILLTRLLYNLLENACKAGSKIHLIFDMKTMVLSNDGRLIPEKQLKKMNRGKALAPTEYDGSGQGFVICRDIVALHHGLIKIVSDHGWTTVTVAFKE